MIITRAPGTPPGSLGRPLRRRRRCSTRDDRRGVPARGVRRRTARCSTPTRRSASSSTPTAPATSRATTTTSAADRRADARRHVLVRRPRLPRRRRLRLLRRPHRRLAAGRRRELRGRARSSGSSCATPRSAGSRCTPCPTTHGRRPGDGRLVLLQDDDRSTRRRSRRSWPTSPTSAPRPGRATSGSPRPSRQTATNKVLKRELVDQGPTPATGCCGCGRSAGPRSWQRPGRPRT